LHIELWRLRSASGRCTPCLAVAIMVWGIPLSHLDSWLKHFEEGTFPLWNYTVCTLQCASVSIAIWVQSLEREWNPAPAILHTGTPCKRAKSLKRVHGDRDTIPLRDIVGENVGAAKITRVWKPQTHFKIGWSPYKGVPVKSGSNFCGAFFMSPIINNSGVTADIVSNIIDFLGEYEAIFETALGCESGP
jgi:hypothetical protein